VEGFMNSQQNNMVCKFARFANVNFDAWYNGYDPPCEDLANMVIDH
jgi:hypothetical protein